MMEVVLYGTEECPFCQKARAFLSERDIAFTAITSPPGSAAWNAMKKLTGGETLPQILIGDMAIGGYADLVNLELTGRLEELLGVRAGKRQSSLYDVIIIGAGPAGLSAAIYTIRKMLKTLIISKDIGGQITWTSDVENYLGFSQVNASELVAKFEDHVKKFEVEKVIGKEVRAVDLVGRSKRIETGDGKSYYGKTVIIATGGRHRPLNIPGERELVGKGVAYCSTCDAPLFAGADVAVVGGGNSALGAVVDLMGIATRIYLISLTALTGDPVYREKVVKSEKVEIFTEHQPTRVIGETMVEGLEFKSLASGELKTITVEGVFVEIGIQPSTSLFLDILTTNDKGEILIDTECRTGLAGVFACGDVTTVPFKQVVVAVGEGSKAALSAYSYLISQK
jgi:NADH-dependent peroxiredoxin subunit F